MSFLSNTYHQHSTTQGTSRKVSSSLRKHYNQPTQLYSHYITISLPDKARKKEEKRAREEQQKHINHADTKAPIAYDRFGVASHRRSAINCDHE